MLPLDKSLCTVAVIPCRTWDRAISFVVIFSILLFIRRVRNDIVPYPYTMPTPPRRCSASEASPHWYKDYALYSSYQIHSGPTEKGGRLWYESYGWVGREVFSGFTLSAARRRPGCHFLFTL